MADTRFIVRDTGIFHPLTRDVAFKSSEIGFVVLDRHEQRLFCFDQGGRRLLARKGPGPGELERANRVIGTDTEIYVPTATSVQVFSSDGSYLETLRLPAGLRIEKLRNGWLGFRWSNRRNEASLSLLDARLEEQAVLAEWEESSIGGTFVVPGRPTPFNPSPDRSFFAVDRARDKVFLRLPGTSEITVIDPATRQTVGAIDLGSRPIPFDRERGKQVLSKRMARTPGLVLEGDFPEFYPAAHDLRIDPAGFVVVAREAGHEGLSLRRFDWRGHAVPPGPLGWHDIERVIAVEGDDYYVTYETEREDYGIARVPKTEIGGFLRAHPISE